jgi:hypothetical protein
MFQGMTGHDDLSPAARNRALQLDLQQHEQMPGVREQVAQQVAERENEILMASLNTAVGIFRSRCRAAANKKDRAQAHAEKLIAQVDQKIRDLRPSPGCSIEETTRRLGDMKLYLTKIDEGLPSILAEIGQVAADQQRQENLEAATRRHIGYQDEARRLGSAGSLRELEKGQLRLVMRDGVLGFVGASRLDDRQLVLLAAHRANIERDVIEREQWHPVDAA